MKLQSKKNYSMKAPIILFSLAFIGLVILLITGIKLANTNLVTFDSNGETVISIPKEQEYFVLLDTGGVRDEIEVSFYDLTNYIIINDENNEPSYTTQLLIRQETEIVSGEIEPVEFDKQIRTKGHLSFGSIILKEESYTFTTQNIVEDDTIGDFALLGADYVKNIGFFSFSAIATFTFALLGYKSYRDYEKRPLSKYMQKHIKQTVS